MLRNIRIISLGEIVTPNLMKGLQALTTAIASKKEEEKSVAQSVQAVVMTNQSAIDQFKQGTLSEADFDKQFIAALKGKTGVELTVEAFNQAWAAMNPKYEDFGSSLDQAVEYNNGKNQKIIFISYTNPKDMRQLVGELLKHKQDYKVDDNGNLIEIRGIQVHLTYLAKKTKAKLIEDVITGLKTEPQMAESKATIFSVPGLDIKYIYGVNQITFDALSKDFNNTTQSVKEAAAAFFVETILWNKGTHKELKGILSTEKPVCVSLAAAKL